MNTDTPETDDTLAANGFAKKWVESNFARRLERERDQARQERDELANAIRSFCTDYEAIQWGYDGDGGSARLADILFESLEKLKETKSEGV